MTDCSWSHKNTKSPAFSILWSRQITAQEKGMNCSSVCFAEAFLVGEICLLLELCCSFSIFWYFTVILQTCMALREHLQDYGSHELHNCPSQESLKVYTQDASASMKHSLELQGSQEKWHSCIEAAVPPLERPQVLSQESWERAQRLCLLAVSRGFVKWNSWC